MFGVNRFYFIFSFIFIFLFDQTSSECRELTPCSCIFPNGHGYNLTGLINEGVIKAISNNYTFYFQGCKNVPLSNTSKSECNTPASLCLQVNNDSFILGTVEETKIELYPDKKLPTLTMHHKLKPGNITTTMISLSCSDQYRSQLIVNEILSKAYNLTLLSPFACNVLLHTSEGLSTGAIVFILLLVFGGIYFIGGALALKFLRGATGWEMLPNHEFWCSLPTFVKNGCTSISNCCRGDSYDRI